MLTHTHQLLSKRATERYENCRYEVYPLADGHGRAGIFIFDLQMLEKNAFLHEVGVLSNNLSLYAVLGVERLLLRAVTWRHSTKRVFREPLRCVRKWNGFFG